MENKHQWTFEQMTFTQQSKRMKLPAQQGGLS